MLVFLIRYIKINQFIWFDLVDGILYVCRFTLTSDKEWFDKELLNVVTEVLGPEYCKMSEPNHVFVDFMRYCYHLSV
jgi:hypothetical protein